MGQDGGKEPNKPRIRTMEELSVAIGVSRPTLSRYFQDPGAVSRSSAEKIRGGLDRVEYVPNFFATRMNRKSTGIIGVLIPYLNDLFFTKLLEAVERAAMEAGYTVITQCSHSDARIEARAAETFMSMSVDGALVAPLGNHSDLKVHERLNSRLPFVLVDSRPDSLSNVDFVGTDHAQSTGLITDYLCQRGDPPIFLAMPRVNFNALERENAYVARMEAAGHPPVVIGTDAVDETWHFEAHGEAVLDACFSRGAHTRASILCANDRLAIGALRAAARHGLEAGATRHGGLRIAGHDDYPLCPFLTPSLTTVAQDVDAIGRAAVSRLVHKIRAEDAPSQQTVQLFPGAMKVRESA
ncbi:LacI family transcriptional regulator [Jannaschia sp. S6380]|uniref:LacI family DNA-binding transcriptional regulator n=1 Tax=Jannaschia sp. S6380 TaxID=2926408 RepID=UPI001FF2A9FC|nr:LacI family DNA-binding transcriptional regulator [Jannaschia sp. S6380]MCK0168222.1 LacI family transcriptional regulator [Jannaschia sp. S6380]